MTQVEANSEYAFLESGTYQQGVQMEIARALWSSSEMNRSESETVVIHYADPSKFQSAPDRSVRLCEDTDKYQESVMPCFSWPSSSGSGGAGPRDRLSAVDMLRPAGC